MSFFALLEKLTPQIEKEVNLLLNVEQDADTLSSKLKKIQDGLEDAERKAVTEAHAKNWLEQLEDVAYQMDDLLDEWETAKLRQQLERSEDKSGLWEKARSFIICLCLCFKDVVGRRQFAQKMKSLSDRLDNILKEKDRYNFVPNQSHHSQEFERVESISLVDESRVKGRDHDKDTLVQKLVSEGEQSKNGTQVISIVGVGGVGKTTLTQLAYNDTQVGGYFELKAWVSVPNPFNPSVVAGAILKAIGKSSTDSLALEQLAQSIKAALSNKKFLLVLDDVWTEDRAKWEPLKDCLHGALGSRILVTTRKESVARMMGTTHYHQLHLLSDSDCTDILNGIALAGRAVEEREKLEKIGAEIAEKCNGLPLAARTMGSMLALRDTVQEWRDVLESPLLKYEEEVSDLLRLLMLSYVDLSPLLKRCFLSVSSSEKVPWCTWMN